MRLSRLLDKERIREVIGDTIESDLSWLSDRIDDDDDFLEVVDMLTDNVYNLITELDEELPEEGASLSPEEQS